MWIMHDQLASVYSIDGINDSLWYSSEMNFELASRRPYSYIGKTAKAMKSLLAVGTSVRT